MKSFSDEQLITKYLKGEDVALELLVKRYFKVIFGYVYNQIHVACDSEDITQEVFVKVWKNIRKFETSKSFKAWIFAIAKNSLIDFIRRKKTIPFSKFENEAGENSFVDKLVDASLSVVEIFKQKELAAEMAEAIEKLPEKYYSVLYPRYKENMSFREIAESLGEPINTVKSRYWRALKYIKAMINNE